MAGEKNREMPPLPKVAPLKEEATEAQPKPIEVIALNHGFFEQHRRVEGDRFTVPSMKQLGSWMECVDPEIQKKHLEAMRVKKLKANTAAN